MTRSEFVALCLARTIDPEIALENESVIEALRARDYVRVIELLNEEF